MLWMERFALIFYVMINAILFAVLLFIGSQMSDNSLTFDDFKQCFIIGIILTLIVWFLFRAIDFLFAGPLRREIKKGLELTERSKFH
jgi:hypothetical protein